MNFKMVDNYLLKLIFRKYSKELILAIILSSIANILMLVPTIFMLQVYDRVMVSHSEITLIVIGLISLILLLSMSLAEWLRTRVMISLGSSFEYSLSEKIFKATFLNKLNTTPSNSISSFSDLATAKQLFSGSSTFALLDGPWTPLYIVVMFMLHPWLGYTAILFCINLTFISWMAGKKTKDSKDSYLEEEREFNEYVHSKLQNAEVIEAHGMIESIKKKWWSRHSSVVQSSQAAEDKEFKFITLNKDLTILKQSFALGLGAILVINGELSVGSMIAATLLMTRATAPIDLMLSGWKNFQQSLSALKRLEITLSSFESGDVKVISPSLQGAINIKNLNWNPSKKHFILNDINLFIQPGEFNLIYGPSGSGKSTVLKAILNLLPDYEGKILYDSYSIKDLNWFEIGHQLGYVSQNYELFDGTVADNIARMGEIDQEEVINAAKIVGIHEFILRLPNGYDTTVGINSYNLSAGQTQELALARAIYKQPKILILDEPDSNLDDNGMKGLFNIFNDAKSRGCTICMVTHNKELFKDVDKIIYMDSGRIVNIDEFSTNLNQ